jgi:hypothetical protein
MKILKRLMDCLEQNKIVQPRLADLAVKIQPMKGA